ncbi:hypothetical protein [Nocardia veterana]|uniref:Uncharacterized protein n=1 Tax=Nocardia veterana TaxID=132249 RepID=A0A7X6M0U2_9NOCA|nr:hypothetical protein [Nocardia veterana]NKY88168.1 hypothetical protein [Nocardia veterana]
MAEGAKNNTRRHLNQTFFERFYLDDTEVVDDQRTPLFEEIAETQQIYLAPDHSTTTGINPTGSRTPHGAPPTPEHERSPRDAEASQAHPEPPSLAGVLKDASSSKAALVGLTGFEPATT